jgi:hypothetical protein
MLEKQGPWFFGPLAALITAAGRLLLAMTEACVEEKQGTYLFCDTDSLAIVASKNGSHLRIPGSDGKKILTWDAVRTIVDRFASLNPYDQGIVKGSILNVVDANYVDSDPSKPQRQLYGHSIAAKRYTLYLWRGKSEIEVVDPKAHGIGFLYPPKDSPKDWEESVPQWTYELWDCILRDALKLRKHPPSWLDVPQMMRITITTYNVLEMLGEWKIARPYNFLLLPMVDPTFGCAFPKSSGEKVLLICPFSSKQEEWFQNGFRLSASMSTLDRHTTWSIAPRPRMYLGMSFSLCNSRISCADINDILRPRASPLTGQLVKRRQSAYWAAAM